MIVQFDHKQEHFKAMFVLSHKTTQKLTATAQAKGNKYDKLMKKRTTNTQKGKKKTLKIQIKSKQTKKNS